MVTKTVTTRKVRFGGWRLTVWRTLRSETAEPRDQARSFFLGRVAVVRPEVLRALIKISPDDTDALKAWSVKWGLTSTWERSYARKSLREWQAWPRGRGRVWSAGPDDVVAEWEPTTGRRAKSPKVLRISARHFDWLVRARVRRRESVLSIATAHHVDPGTVHRAIRALSAALDFGKIETRPKSRQ